MNTEELELSLRTEFETYLKNMLAEMQQEATDFQSRMEGEFDRQRSQFDEALRSFSSRFDSERRFDEAFSSTVSEHLRLARDEGARITADAMAEAEKFQEAAVAPQAKYDTLRDAVADISSKDSQLAILKSLVSHAADFAPRGAFFIIKSEHFGGWKVFGADHTDESAVREIHFPISSDTILGEAANSLSTVKGSHSGDDAFISPLQFGAPAGACAIPLVARGRSVAVLYADQGSQGREVNREALETIVRVAGLTVELLAASQAVTADNHTDGTADLADAPHEYETPQEMPAAMPEPVPAFSDESSSFEEPQASSSFETEQATPFEAAQPSPFQTEQPSPFESEEPVEETREIDEPGLDHQPAQESSFDYDETHSFEPAGSPFSAEPQPDSTEGAMQFEPAATTTSPFDHPANDEYQPAPAVVGGFEPQTEMTPAMVSTPAVRLSDRGVDLPIEVPDDERRIHNDARRFARLLVSEIKLYNEKKVIEGRESRDLYDRLREAIDRSREMYDKRVQPPVAAKFDYFHYEIVNALADGDSDRLGKTYPGSAV